MWREHLMEIHELKTTILDCFQINDRNQTFIIPSMVFMEEVAVKLVADKFPIMHRSVNNNELQHKLDRVRKLIRCDKVFHITTTKG